MTNMLGGPSAMADDFFRLNVRTHPLDSVNALFWDTEPNRTISQFLISIIEVLRTSGWGTGVQTNLYLLDGNGDFKPQDAWRTSPSGIASMRRMHIRLWGNDGPVTWSEPGIEEPANEVVCSAHYEILSMLGGHRVTSFDLGKRRIEEEYRNAGWVVHQDVWNTERRVTKPPCDGLISVIQSR